MDANKFFKMRSWLKDTPVTAALPVMDATKRVNAYNAVWYVPFHMVWYAVTFCVALAMESSATKEKTTPFMRLLQAD